MVGTRIITVFGSSRAAPSEPLYRDALRLGRLLAEAGYAVCCGGYAGVMEAVARGASEAGGTAIGVTVEHWAARVRANRWLTEEIATPTLFERLARLISADAYVALSGGPGTLGEVAITWNLFQTESIPVRPLVLVGAEWRRGLDSLGGWLRITPADLALVRCVDAVDDVLRTIQNAG